MQPAWKERFPAAGRANTSVDWIIVQMHQCALVVDRQRVRRGDPPGSVPLFDEYQVDIVVNGHDHDYERSYPVRGFTPYQGTSTFTGGTVTQASGA